MKRFFRPLSFLVILTLFVTTGQGCLSGGGSTTVTAEQVTLDYWRVFDDEDAFDQIINDYRAIHPNVTINYRKLRFDEYETELLKAMAEGRGPDILSVHNTWMGEYQTRLLPMPASVTVTQTEQRGSLRRETVTVAKENPTMSMRQLKDAFVDQVEKDVVLPYQPNPKIDPVDRVYGLPLSLDSLALFYNKDLLNAAGISTPPATWSETDFHEKVTKLTTYNERGEVSQSGVAMGRADNIERSTDIATLLMMQVGTEMTDERGRINFQNVPKSATEGTFPTLNALQFYTDFANPTKKVYTWNETYKSSFDAFANGKTAMFLGYSYHIPLLRTASPKLNFGISTIPQISQSEDIQKVNFANYWVESVASSTEHPDWAWDFLLFETNAQHVGSYLNKAKRPAAQRSLIETQLEDEDLGPFAEQTLTARSWYNGKDVGTAETAIKDMINAILTGASDPEDAIDIAARKVSETLN